MSDQKHTTQQRCFPSNFLNFCRSLLVQSLAPQVTQHVTQITYECRRLPTQTHSDLPRGNRCRWYEGNTHPNGAPALLLLVVVMVVGHLMVVVVAVVVAVAVVVLGVLPDHNWPTTRRQ